MTKLKLYIIPHVNGLDMHTMSIVNQSFCERVHRVFTRWDSLHNDFSIFYYIADVVVLPCDTRQNSIVKSQLFCNGQMLNGKKVMKVNKRSLYINLNSTLHQDSLQKLRYASNYTRYNLNTHIIYMLSIIIYLKLVSMPNTCINLEINIYTCTYT